MGVGPGNWSGVASELQRTPTADRYASPIIESAWIVSSDAADYVVDAMTESTGRLLIDLPVASPYAHPANGEGIYAVPEVGASCWVCVPSERDRKPFVLGFGGAPDTDGSYKNLRRSLNPGDIFLGGRNNNFVILRRGGILQIGGGPLAQRMYLPVGGMIRDFGQQYELRTMGGELEWTMEEPEEDPDGNRKTLLTLRSRKKVGDPEAVCILEQGSIEGEDSTHLRLTIKASGEDGAEQVARLKITEDGEINWDLSGAFKVATEDEIDLEAAKTIKVISTGSTVEISASSTLKLKSDTLVTVDAPTIKLGGDGASTPPVLASADLVTFLASHTHAVSGGTTLTPTSPPMSYTSNKIVAE